VCTGVRPSPATHRLPHGAVEPTARGRRLGAPPASAGGRVGRLGTARPGGRAAAVRAGRRVGPTASRAIVGSAHGPVRRRRLRPGEGGRGKGRVDHRARAPATTSQPPQPPPHAQHYAAAAQQHPAAAAAASALGAALGGDPFVAGLAASALQGGSAGYLEKGTAWASARFGALAPARGGRGLACLDVTPRSVGTKLLMLLTPWSKRWTYTRLLEACPGGGTRPAPPCRDVAAADAYVPLMAALTLALLRGVGTAAASSFTPDALSGAASGAFTAWGLHAAVLRGAATVLRLGSGLPLADLVAAAGYPLAHGAAGCAARLGSRAAGGGAGPRAAADAAVAALGAAAAVFLVRTLKRVAVADAGRGRRGGDNYVLLGLAAAQVALVWWAARGCA